MRKRVLAFLTAVCCMAGSASVIPAFAEEELPVTRFAILSQSGNKAVIMELEKSQDTDFLLTYINWQDAKAVEAFTDFQTGDIIEYAGHWGHPDGVGTNYFIMEGDGTFEKIGSVFETPETADFELTDDSFFLKLSDGETSYTYFNDWAAYSVLPPLPFDFSWNSVEVGDTISFYTYEGVPVIPYERKAKANSPETKSRQKGDVNADGTVDIIDVLTVNQALLGINELSETALEFADVDGNGEMNDTDAMMILKSLVGLENLNG